MYGRRFVLRTDHQALATLLSITGSGQRLIRLHRWADRLHRYNFSVQYRPGKQNQVADFLSRVNHQIVGGLSDEQDAAAEDDSLWMQTLRVFSDTVVSLEELEQESVVDDITQEVFSLCRKDGH